MDLSNSAVNDEDSRITSIGSLSAGHIEHDSEDSDDLQFVDDLNEDPEPLEKHNAAVVPSEPASNVSAGVTPSIAFPTALLASTDQISTPPTDHVQPTGFSSCDFVNKPISERQDVLPLVNPPSSPSSQLTIPSDMPENEQCKNQTTSHPDQNSTVLTNKALVDTTNRSLSDPPSEEDKSSQSVSVSTSKPTAVNIIIKHFIDGFVIEESTSAFPVHRSSLLTELLQQTKKKVSRRRTTGGVISQSSLLQRDNRPTPPVTPIPTIIKVQSQAAMSDICSEINDTPASYGNNTPMGDILTNIPRQDREYESCAMCGTDCIDLCFYRGDPYCSRRCTKKRKSRLFTNPDAPPPKRGRPIGAMTRNKPTHRNSGKLAKVIFRKYRPKASVSDGSEKGAPATIVKQEPESLSSTPDYTDYIIGRFPAENGYESEDSALEGSETTLGSSYKRVDVLHWTVSDVRDFIQSLSGCERYGLEFEEQEIDGKALLLLNEDHLLIALDIKLGPALKIHSEINAFR